MTPPRSTSARRRRSGCPIASTLEIVGDRWTLVILRDLLNGKADAYRDIVLLNTAAAFLVADTVETLREGVELAGQVIDDGRALKALDQLVAITNG